MKESLYPLPQPNAQTQPFWDGTQIGELRYQRCDDCGKPQLMPRSLCEHCHSTQLSWHISGKKGTILTYTIVHRAPLAIFRSKVPYAIVIVDMDEGFRVMANATRQAQEALQISKRIEIGFQNRQGMSLPIVQAVLTETP